MVRRTKLKTVLPVVIPAIILIVFTDAQLRKMERFEELVAKGQGINSPLADFLHRRFGSTLAIKQIREDLEFEIEPIRRLKLWTDLVDSHQSQGDIKGVINACASWIEEYPNDPRTLRAYEEVIQELEKQNDTAGIQKYLQGWENSIIAIGPEAKLSEMLKWWEFALAHPRLVDETPIFERVFQDYPKHVPSLGALKSLAATYRMRGKTKEAAAVLEQIKTLDDRATSLQRNQSDQQALQFLLNQRAWDQLQEHLVSIFNDFPNSLNFDGLLKRIYQQSGEVLGPDKQLDFYRQTVDLTLRRVPADRQANNIPFSGLVGDYGMMLWNKGLASDAWKVTKILQTAGPRTASAFQLERLLWLRDPSTPIRLPHAALTPVTEPPFIDGLQSDRCWFGDEHLVGELKPVIGAESHPTQIWATYDKKYFYLLVKCQEPNVDGITRQVSQSSAWMSDCIETFFNPSNDYSSYFQFVGNAHGVINSYQFIVRDQNIKNAALEPIPWDAKAETAVNLSSDSWTYEMRIPWAQLGIEPTPGKAFFFNARRFRFLGGRQSIYSWAPVQSSAHEIETFGILQIK
jgi:tetratricopeptide (TPR) repeat protein